MGLTTTDHEEIVMDNRAFSGNRRTVLSSFAAIGAVAALPVAVIARPATNRAAWDAAMAEYVRADRAMNQFHDDVLNPAFDRLMAAERAKDALGTETAKAAHKAEFAAYDPLEDRFDDLVMERFDAVNTLGKVPAPDRAALKRKMDILVTEERWQCDDMGELFMAIHADFARLLGDA